MTKRGFTLIEMLVVIAIIGILSSMIILGLKEARLKAKDTIVKHDIREFSKLATNFGISKIDNQGWINLGGFCSQGPGTEFDKLKQDILQNATNFQCAVGVYLKNNVWSISVHLTGEDKDYCMDSHSTISDEYDLNQNGFCGGITDSNAIYTALNGGLAIDYKTMCKQDFYATTYVDCEDRFVEHQNSFSPETPPLKHSYLYDVHEYLISVGSELEEGLMTEDTFVFYAKLPGTQYYACIDYQSVGTLTETPVQVKTKDMLSPICPQPYY